MSNRRERQHRDITFVLVALALVAATLAVPGTTAGAATPSEATVSVRQATASW